MFFILLDVHCYSRFNQTKAARRECILVLFLYCFVFLFFYLIIYVMCTFFFLFLSSSSSSSYFPSSSSSSPSSLYIFSLIFMCTFNFSKHAITVFNCIFLPCLFFLCEIFRPTKDLGWKVKTVLKQYNSGSCTCNNQCIILMTDLKEL